MPYPDYYADLPVDKAPFDHLQAQQSVRDFVADLPRSPVGKVLKRDLRAQLEKVYTQLAKNPTNKDLKKAQKEVETVLKAKTSEENKAYGEDLRRLRSEVRTAAAKCTDVEKLEAVLEILDEYTDLAYRIED